jgi:hypothetical protein
MISGKPASKRLARAEKSVQDIGQAALRGLLAATLG